MQVYLLGTRGSIPSGGAEFTRYGGNTSCVAISADGEVPSLILDAGSGLAAAGWAIGDAPFRGSILLSHVHWDHVLGLPFFREGDRPGSEVELLIPQQHDDAEDVLQRFFSPPLFPIDINGLRGNWKSRLVVPGEYTIQNFEVTIRDVPHKGGRTFGFRISDGTNSLAYIPDHSPTTLGPGPHGDGAHHEAALELAANVDLLIHDSQYTPEEFVERFDWGHCKFSYPIGLADAAGAKQTVLFHHDPFRTDAEIDALQDSVGRPDVSFAIEGSVISLGSPQA